jgi:hypothetical protein
MYSCHTEWICVVRRNPDAIRQADSLTMFRSDILEDNVPEKILPMVKKTVFNVKASEVSALVQPKCVSSGEAKMDHAKDVPINKSRIKLFTR